jgi:hypothetical protein
LNTSFGDVADQISNLTDTVNSSNVISQTLSLVGKDVTVDVPTYDEQGHYQKDDSGNVIYGQVSGTVDEVSFDNGDGMVTIGGNQYSISNISSIRNAAQ